MIWFLFALAWCIGGLWFCVTTGADYVERRTNDEISWAALIAITVASGPLVWAAMIALAVWGEE